VHQKANYYAEDLINTRILDKVGAYSKYTEVLPVEDIINGMLDWVRVIDHNGVIIYANKAMQDDFDYPIIGKKCYEVFCQKEPCDNCISKMVSTDGETHEKEEKFSDRYFSVKSSPIKDRNGDVIAVVEVLRDITNEKILNQKLMLKNKQLKDDINIAKKIQMSFLPTKLKQDKVNFSFIYNPCEELGGDFLDIFMIDEDHMGLYIADVAGHGITASLLTVFLRSSFNRTTLSPSVALTELYNEFNEVGFDANLYITVFYAILDFKNNIITYANAGHSTCPIVFNDTRFEILRSPGLPICNWSEKTNYPEKRSELFKNDRVFFCTDGIIEARNSNDEQFGEERLLKILTSKKESPDIVLNNIICEACEFMGKECTNCSFDDDITMVLLEIK